MNYRRRRIAPDDFNRPVKVLYSVSPPDGCDCCGERRCTYNIHNNYTYLCGNDGYGTACEGTRFLKYIVAEDIPEPQEP